MKICDYNNSEETDVISGEICEIKLPKSNVLSFTCADGSSLIARPSGTEPKIKFYYSVRGKTMAEAEAKVAALQSAVQEIMK